MSKKAEIEETAREIIATRSVYSECSFDDMYGEKIYMFPKLLQAHQANDRAVMQAYGFEVKTMTESSCVAELMKMYKKMQDG